MKRQRLDSPSHTRIGPPLIRAPPPPRHPDHAVAGSSTSSFSGFDHSYPSPHSHPRPQEPAVPESSNSLQAYAKDKVYSDGLSLQLTYIKSDCVWVCVRACRYALVRATCVCALSWVVRWWSCLRHASSKLQIWIGRRGAVHGCSKTYSESMQVCMTCIHSPSTLTSCCDSYSLNVFLTVARLYLTGSSMNGLGCRSSDADLCLVLKGNVSMSHSLQRAVIVSVLNVQS